MANVGNACIFGDCFVRVAILPGSSLTSRRRISQLNRGDVVCSSNGWSVVEAILCSTTTELSRLPGGLRITPWHPIRDNAEAEWRFAATYETSRVEIVDVTPVYSILFQDRAVSVCVQDKYDCICLAHAISNDAVATHPFYGTEQVVHVMKTEAGWNVGRVQFQQNRRTVGCRMSTNARL